VLDGVIGSDLFETVVTTVDYARGVVVLDDDFTSAMQGGAHAIPLKFHDGLPQVACRLERAPGRCTIDTGSRLGATIFAPFVARYPKLVPAHASAIGVDGFGLGGPAYGRLARLHSLAFGGFVLRDLACDYSTQREGAFADPETAARSSDALPSRSIIAGDASRCARTRHSPCPIASIAPDSFSSRRIRERSRYSTFVPVRPQRKPGYARAIS